MLAGVLIVAVFGIGILVGHSWGKDTEARRWREAATGKGHVYSEGKRFLVRPYPEVTADVAEFLARRGRACGGGRAGV